ncbi:Rhs family protein, partial [mine drainage metagenome]
ESLNASYGSREGFTGGQDLTSLGVVVLGARIYDPALGRWLAPDPAGMSASPYVYVGDDPEGLTDPTGAFSLGAFFFQDVVVGTDAAMADAMTYIGGAIGGFVWGYASTGGNLRDGVIGAVDGAAMGYLGGLTYAPGAAGVIEKGLLEGSVGGVATEATGGSFVGGFLGAFSGAVMEPGLSYGSFGQDVLSVTIASAVGGTVSVIGGGSFANGALSAAFQQMFNAVAH